MKNIIIFILSIFISSVASASIDTDSLLLAQTDEPLTDAESAEALGIAPLEAPTLSDPQQLKTYTNWAHEICIAEQPGNTKAHPYYTWKRDLTYAGIPIFLSSFLIKSKKKAFRSARFTFDENFKTEIDNYTQFSPYALILGLKAFGYQGRSSWDRFLVSTLASNAVMALAVNATKYSVKEMRPDNSSENSFPSGHTATAFVAATVLHKEYGLTRSPWFSVGGYAVATGTGIMRVLNNRHWISDVIAGAGIGIMSTELGYWLGDLIYKNKGICRLEQDFLINPNHPSFFDIQMGIASHSNSIVFSSEDYGESVIDLGTSSVVGVEGAYFINKYLGFGGMARVTTTPTKNTSLTSNDKSVWNELNEALEEFNIPGVYNLSIENNNFMDVSLDAGIYGNLPLSKRLAVGGKFLVGSRLSGGISYQARNGFRKAFRDEKGNQIYTFDGTTQTPMYMFERPDGTQFAANEVTMPGVSTEYNYALDEEKIISDEYDIMKVEGDNVFNYVFGLSFTYKYKNNFSWKIFADFDSAKNNYTANYHYVSDEVKEKYPIEEHPELKVLTEDDEFKTSKRLNLWTFGASFSINF